MEITYPSISTMSLTTTIIDKIWEAIKYFLSRRKAGDAFVDAAEILSLMRETIGKKELNIERILLVKAHNDGGTMMPISYNYASVVLESFSDNFKSARERYNKFPLTEPIMETIAETYVKKGISIDVSKIPDKHELLKSMFEADKVKFSQFHFLKHKKTALWFLSIATSKDNEHFETAEHQIEIYTLTNKIKQRIKSY